jgi:hypothetical protein
MHTLFPLGLAGMPETKMKLVGILLLIGAVNAALLVIYTLAVAGAVALVF